MFNLLCSGFGFGSFCFGLKISNKKKFEKNARCLRYAVTLSVSLEFDLEILRAACNGMKAP